MYDVQHVNWGRSAQMPRECAPDDVQAGGASVVVGDRESRLHGEERQFVVVCLAD